MRRVGVVAISAIVSALVALPISYVLRSAGPNRLDAAVNDPGLTQNPLNRIATTITTGTMTAQIPRCHVGETLLLDPPYRRVCAKEVRDAD